MVASRSCVLRMLQNRVSLRSRRPVMSPEGNGRYRYALSRLHQSDVERASTPVCSSSARCKTHGFFDGAFSHLQYTQSFLFTLHLTSLSALWCQPRTISLATYAGTISTSILIPAFLILSTYCCPSVAGVSIPPPSFCASVVPSPRRITIAASASSRPVR